MAAELKSYWQNCALQPDEEIVAIDQMEKRLAPLAPNIIKIRELISRIELCHHKSERWINLIIEAIGAGETRKEPGSQGGDHKHPAEQTWQNACIGLSAWCSGIAVDVQLNKISVKQLVAVLGNPTALKIWQVERIIEKIKSVIESEEQITYKWLMLSGGDYKSMYHNSCPDYFKDVEEFWLQTVKTIIHDSIDGQPTRLSLALAIDMLWPCHWRFVTNLQVVLDAIGGRLNSDQPFSACGRNIRLLPNRQHMKTISQTLKYFYSKTAVDHGVDHHLLDILGEPANVKQWLAASLDKTIRLQLNPPEELRRISDLTGPDWI